MTWTYDVTQLATSALMQARRLIGDVLTGDQQLQDEEINWTIGQYSNVYLGAAACCRNIAAQFSRQVDLVQGELKTNYSQRAKSYMAMAKDFEARGLATGAIPPPAGGISIADKTANVEDPDRVPPDFNRGQFDDLLPVGPVGQQTPTPGAPDASSDGLGTV